MCAKSSVNISRFHEGLFTLKSFLNALVGFKKFCAETSRMLCSYDIYFMFGHIVTQKYFI